MENKIRKSQYNNCKNFDEWDEKWKEDKTPELIEKKRLKIS